MEFLNRDANVGSAESVCRSVDSGLSCCSIGDAWVEKLGRCATDIHGPAKHLKGTNNLKRRSNLSNDSNVSRRKSKESLGIHSFLFVTEYKREWLTNLTSVTITPMI